MQQLFCKVAIVLSGLFFFSLHVVAQDDYSRPLNGRNDSDSCRICHFIHPGGGGGLQLGTVFYAEIAPRILFSLTNRFNIGLGGIYIFYRENIDGSIYSSNVFGGSFFTNYILYRNFFPHFEYEQLNFEYYNNQKMEWNRKWLSSPFIGIGYQQKTGKRAFLQVVGLYNLNFQIVSPYTSPWVPKLTIYF